MVLKEAVLGRLRVRGTASESSAFLPFVFGNFAVGIDNEADLWTVTTLVD